MNRIGLGGVTDVLLKSQEPGGGEVQEMIEIVDQLRLIVIPAVVDDIEPVYFFAFGGVILYGLDGLEETFIPADLPGAISKILFLQ
jgi:hypothetical protein